MMRKRSILLFMLWVVIAIGVSAQVPRTAYHLDGFVFRHYLNPAFQPDSNYLSLPLLGNTSVSTGSSMGMSSLIFNQSDGTQTTFMSRGTISKSDLMKKVGSSFNNSSDVCLTLVSLGRRLSADRYQTLSVNIRAMEDLCVDKSVFDMLKDVENKTYDISGTRCLASSFAEIAVGESRRLNTIWTIGGKAKLLIGLADIDFSIDQMQVNFDSNCWTAQGRAYKNLSNPGFRGIGAAVDLGASCRLSENWQLSLAVRDLGFISWFSTIKFTNNGELFSFDGFHDACIDNPDEEYQSLNPDKEPIQDKLDRLEDDFNDLVRLEETGKDNVFRMLGATVHFGAAYYVDKWKIGALLTSYVRGKMSWYEGRLNATWYPIPQLNFTLAPACSSYGYSAGAMINYRPAKGYQISLGSDALVWKVNRQFIPTNLDGSIYVSFALPL